MNTHNLVFHIHYCNGRKYRKPDERRPKLTRTLQHHELFFVSGGKGSIILGNKKYAFKEGMLFYILPGVLHTLDIDTEEPAAFMSVHFSFVNVAFNEEAWAFTEEPKALAIPAAQQLKDYYMVEELFRKLVDCWHAKLPGYVFAARTQFQQLLIAIYQNMKKQDRNYATSLKVEKIIQYMQDHVEGKVTLDELAALVQLSPAYLSRTFKETTGNSVIEFFNRLKIDKAKELILEGNMKIKEVAGALGFSDEFYFSRIFKAAEGISPSEFHSKNVHVV